MAHTEYASEVWIVRRPERGSDADTTAAVRGWAVHPRAVVGPASLLAEDPSALAVLTAPTRSGDGLTGPPSAARATQAAGVRAVMPLGDGATAVLELDAALAVPEVDRAAAEKILADPGAPAELAAYARLVAGLEPEPGAKPAAAIVCILFPRLTICRKQKKR